MADKLLFYDAFHKRETIPSPVGTHEEPLFELQMVEGIETLVEVGKRNVNDYIQSSLEDTKIYNILSRYANGDESVLHRSNGVYGDFLKVMPTSLAEAQKVLIKVENDFNRLPSEIKAKFDNSISNYIETISKGGLDKFNEIFNVSAAENVSSEKIEKKEVSVNEKIEKKEVSVNE